MARSRSAAVTNPYCLNLPVNNCKMKSRPRSIVVTYSGSKLQNFFGADVTQKKTNKKAKKDLNRSKKSINRKINISLKRFQKSGHNKSKSMLSRLDEYKDNNNNNKCILKPSLTIIYKDELLLKILIKYMEDMYNSENILFTQYVQQLKQKTNDIDDHIRIIYENYIESNSKQQINLSSVCFKNILSKRQLFINYSLTQKRKMFDLCVREIETLIISSILPEFYRSKDFQNNIRKSDYFKSKYSPYSALTRLKSLSI